MYKNTKENIESMAIATLLDIWGCLDWEKIDKRRAYGIWDEFSSKVKASAITTNSYEKFVEKLARKMDVRSLRYRDIEEIREQSEEIKQSILNLIRTETLQLVLKVRLNNEARKEQRAAIKKEVDKKDESNKKVVFTNKGVEVNE